MDRARRAMTMTGHAATRTHGCGTRRRAPQSPDDLPAAVADAGALHVAQRRAWPHSFRRSTPASTWAAAGVPPPEAAAHRRPLSGADRAWLRSRRRRQTIGNAL